jgi:hypothetical protein
MVMRKLEELVFTIGTHRRKYDGLRRSVRRSAARNAIAGLALVVALSGQEVHVPPATQIIDKSGNVWTLTAGVVSKNGVPDPTATGDVSQLSYIGYSALKLRKFVAHSQKFCGWADLYPEVSGWPLGDTGWVQGAIPFKSVQELCPPKK